MYSKTLEISGYTIDFDYHYRNGELYIIDWMSYIKDQYTPVVCEVTSEYIEAKIRQWLDNEVENNCHVYESDYLDSMNDASYDLFMEK